MLYQSTFTLNFINTVVDVLFCDRFCIDSKLLFITLKNNRTNDIMSLQIVVRLLQLQMDMSTRRTQRSVPRLTLFVTRDTTPAQTPSRAGQTPRGLHLSACRLVNKDTYFTHDLYMHF